MASTVSPPKPWERAQSGGAAPTSAGPSSPHSQQHGRIADCLLQHSPQRIPSPRRKHQQTEHPPLHHQRLLSPSVPLLSTTLSIAQPRITRTPPLRPFRTIGRTAPRATARVTALRLTVRPTACPPLTLASAAWVVVCTVPLSAAWAEACTAVGWAATVATVEATAAWAEACTEAVCPGSMG